MRESYPLEKYIILKTLKFHSDYSTWKLMIILRRLGFSIPRPSHETLIKSLMKDGYIQFNNISRYKRRKSYSILITEKGLNRLTELENLIKTSLNAQIY